MTAAAQLPPTVLPPGRPKIDGIRRIGLPVAFPLTSVVVFPACAAEAAEQTGSCPAVARRTRPEADPRRAERPAPQRVGRAEADARAAQRLERASRGRAEPVGRRRARARPAGSALTGRARLQDAEATDPAGTGHIRLMTGHDLAGLTSVGRRRSWARRRPQWPNRVPAIADRVIVPVPGCGVHCGGGPGEQSVSGFFTGRREVGNGPVRRSSGRPGSSGPRYLR